LGAKKMFNKYKQIQIQQQKKFKFGKLVFSMKINFSAYFNNAVTFLALKNDERQEDWRSLSSKTPVN